MSLRRRLVLVTVAVVAIALAAADVGAYLALRSMLVTRVEQDLVVAARASTKMFLDPAFVTKTATVLDGRATNIAYVVFDPKGAVAARAPAVGNDKRILPEPVLPDPSSIPRLPIQGESPALPAGATIEVPAIAGGFDYAVTSVEGPPGWLMVVAMPLTEAAATLRQLAIVEVIMTLAVVGFVAVVASRIVALGLRPLGRIEDTASAIAAGDLGRRIESVDRRTEVGRLGLSLNTMLGRIEAALAAREASEQRLRHLVTDASHELRTPLTAIRGYAELFRRGADQRPADLARAMRGIELESERMGILVDQLLLLARLDEGQALPAADEDLVLVVRAAVDAARAVEPDRPLELRVPATAVVRGDATRLRQVIDNLLANVRVHTPPGTAATVSVRAARDRVILEVADEGPGLSETARARVFERFFRADPSRSRDSGGSGLGLAIVAAIARSYGGEVGVESAPGKGSRFMVDLPAAGP